MLFSVIINGLDDGTGCTFLKLTSENSLEGIIASWQMGSRIQNYLNALKQTMCSFSGTKSSTYEL